MWTERHRVWFGLAHENVRSQSRFIHLSFASTIQKNIATQSYYLNFKTYIYSQHYFRSPKFRIFIYISNSSNTYEKKTYQKGVEYLILGHKLRKLGNQSTYTDLYLPNIRTLLRKKIGTQQKCWVKFAINQINKKNRD